MGQNTKINQSRVNKNDEFYTSLTDIENEVKHYWDQLEGKKIWCNCDDPIWSNFHHFFENQKFYHNFEVKYTHYELNPDNKNGLVKKELDKPFTKRNKHGAIQTYTETWVDSEGYCQGDFRAKEQQKLWEWADVIITNPPFSLFREFVSYLMKYQKKFLIIGGQNNIYKETFKLVKTNQMWLGYNFHLANFEKITDGKIEILDAKNPNGAIPRACTWFTNLDTNIRHHNLILQDWDDKKFVKYDNYDAYETVWLYGEKGGVKAQYPFTKKILGAPITFLQKYNPDQFKIIDFGHNSINGKMTYKRIFIQLTDEYYNEYKDVYEN